MRALILRIAVSIVLRTVSVRWENRAALDTCVAQGLPCVLVFWHGSMLFPWWYLRRRNGAALVSMSKDGQLLADLLEAWGYRVLRGSSSRGNKEAMQSMRDALSDGHLLCVTPDGPRGPMHEMKMGALRAAQTMEVPLLMISVGYRRCWRLKSWDRFEVPVPFTRATVRVTGPLRIDAGLEGEALDEQREEMEKLLRAEYRAVTLGV